MRVGFGLLLPCVGWSHHMQCKEKMRGRWKGEGSRLPASTMSNHEIYDTNMQGSHPHEAKGVTSSYLADEQKEIRSGEIAGSG